jgi:hypothetical protein
LSEGDRVEILQVSAAGLAGGSADGPAAVLRAYFEVRRARASRQFLCCTVPVMTLLLLAAQTTIGLAARGAVLAQAALSVVVPAAAAVAEWRAVRKLRALARAGRSS